MSRCTEHNLSEPCPLCHFGAWPLRDLNAVADFAGNPVDRPDGLVPGVRYVKLSDVIRSIGRRWQELEVVKLTALRPIYATKNALVREARIGAIDVGRLEKAARALANGRTSDSDPIVSHYMQTILEDESSW
ncbi:hypothetical protein [Pseudomonas phage phiH2]|uniref:Uncharacterized protein n=1 Tax=Pseudomonas phage phiH2 TaxID=2981578 RepID=A0A977TP93_9CAUD|nr:hypothetical protein P9A55_gp25 [Pseudomonas phage phiH2]UXX42050.1 hypothetical protein [Pseudomonas phage phiH2]